MVNKKGDAGQPCANALRNLVDRFAGIPGAAKRTDLFIIIIIITSALALLVGAWRRWKPVVSASTMTLSDIFLTSVLMMWKGRFNSCDAYAKPTTVRVDSEGWYPTRTRKVHPSLGATFWGPNSSSTLANWVIAISVVGR